MITTFKKTTFSSSLELSVSTAVLSELHTVQVAYSLWKLACFALLAGGYGRRDELANKQPFFV